jgi:hypothetical protein
LGAWAIREAGRMIPGDPAGTLKLFVDFIRGATLASWPVFLAPWILVRCGALPPAARLLIQPKQS